MRVRTAPLQYLALALATFVCAPVILWRSLRGRRREAYEPVWWWARLLITGSGITTNVRGLEQVPEGGRYVVLSNHCSHLDGPVLVLALPDPVYFVIKRELARIPIWGPATLRVGFIAIDRGDTAQARAELARAVEAVRGGRTVLVFPEGTRSPDGRLQGFKKGGFHLAVDAQVPILPVTVNGSAALLPKGAKAPRPGHVDVIVHPPIPTAGLGPDDVPDLIDRTWHAIESGRREDPAYPGSTAP
jgi:1-acyl-sn-glycerol-3-phosphate acyltransferase